MPSATISIFRALHEAGCFLIPNPWDVGSARCLEHLGFSALTTTSAGVAFSRGRPDTLTSLSCDEVLEHVEALVAATRLPLNVDFQDGYGADPQAVAANVARCAATGAAGLSIEDASGDPGAPLYERVHAIERIQAARAAIDACAERPLLTARCEAWLVGHPDAARVTLDRLVAFADAGADCLFAPGLPDADAIAAVVKAVAPKPVNVLISRPIPGLPLSRLTELGVRRVSLGSALARVSFGALLNAARSILETGSFEGLSQAASFAELNSIFGD